MMSRRGKAKYLIPPPKGYSAMLVEGDATEMNDPKSKKFRSFMEAADPLAVLALVISYRAFGPPS